MKRYPATADDSTLTLARVQAENAQLRRQVDELAHQLEWFKRQLFGRKSEKRLLDDSASRIDDLFQSLGSTVPPAEAATEEVRYRRRTGKHRASECLTDTGLRFDDSVPVEVIELSAPELDGPDAEQYEIIDRKITHRLAQRPGSYVVLEYRRPVLKHKPSQKLHTVAAPAAVFEQSIADVSLLGGLLVDKFVYHLPLYRQHQRLADAGITLSRTTLTNLALRAIDLLVPIYDAQWRHILRSRVLAMDETPIKAGRQGKGQMKQTWFWPLYGEADEVCFPWSSSRAHEFVRTELAGFEGVLLSDGYGAYERFAQARERVTLAQCWTHSRRYFVRAQESQPQAVATALDHIGALYRVEAHIRERALEGEQKLRYRVEHSRPLVDAFFAWCFEQRQRPDLLGSEPLAKALSYVHNRREALSVFLADPDVPLDTNHLERALRVIPMGRRNWLFCWTEVGAKQVGVVQSLLTTCRLHGVDPYTYLVDVLQRVDRHPADRVEELTPRRWKELFAANPLRSDLHGLGQ